MVRRARAALEGALRRLSRRATTISSARRKPRHVEKVQRVFERLRESGDVYLGKYEGWYCVNDETFWLESKLVDGRCPTCGREVQWISEEDWFFRLSAYRDRLLEHFERHPQWVQPRSVYNEMMAILARGARRSLDLAHEFRLGRADPGRRRDLRLARRAAQLHHGDRLERGRGALSARTGRRRRSSSARRSRAFTRSSGRRSCGRSARPRPSSSSRTAGSRSTARR